MQTRNVSFFFFYLQRCDGLIRGVLIVCGDGCGGEDSVGGINCVHWLLGDGTRGILAWCRREEALAEIGLQDRSCGGAIVGKARAIGGEDAVFW